MEETDLVELPQAPAIESLRFRRFRGAADYAEIVSIYAGSRQADQSDEATTLEEVTNDYQHLTNCNPNQDVLFAEIDGGVIGYSRVFWEQEQNGDWIYRHLGLILPGWRRRGIGRAMLHQCEHRLRQIAADHPADAPRLFEVYASDTERERLSLYRSEGYQPARYFVVMTRSLMDEIPDLELPQGLELRPAEERHFRQIWDANVEAFRDHWGFAEPQELDYQRWLGDPKFDPKLWKVAWDGDQVAGMVLNFIDQAENQEFQRKRGYTEEICVRRPWRRRGLARALIAQSMQMLREMGYEEAALGADTENLTGAFRLYTDLGYREVKRWTDFRKPMD